MDKLSEQIAEAVGGGRASGPRLLSPRDFLALTADEVARAGRYDRPLSAALIVIDGIALLRRRAGVEAADGVFQTVAECLMRTMRRPDRTGRLGRGEIGVLMPETSVRNAGRVAERLLEAIEAARLGHSLSIGVAGLSPRMRDPKTLLMTACFELRRARSQGGGRVSVATGEVVNVSIPRSGQVH